MFLVCYHSKSPVTLEFGIIFTGIYNCFIVVNIKGKNYLIERFNLPKNRAVEIFNWPLLAGDPFTDVTFRSVLIVIT